MNYNFKIYRLKLLICIIFYCWSVWKDR